MTWSRPLLQKTTNGEIQCSTLVGRPRMSKNTSNGRWNCWKQGSLGRMRLVGLAGSYHWLLLMKRHLSQEKWNSFWSLESSQRQGLGDKKLGQKTGYHSAKRTYIHKSFFQHIQETTWAATHFILCVDAHVGTFGIPWKNMFLSEACRACQKHEGGPYVFVGEESLKMLLCHFQKPISQTKIPWPVDITFWFNLGFQNLLWQAGLEQLESLKERDQLQLEFGAGEIGPDEYLVTIHKKKKEKANAVVPTGVAMMKGMTPGVSSKIKQVKASVKGHGSGESGGIEKDPKTDKEPQKLIHCFPLQCLFIRFTCILSGHGPQKNEGSEGCWDLPKQLKLSLFTVFRKNPTFLYQIIMPFSQPKDWISEWVHGSGQIWNWRWQTDPKEKQRCQEGARQGPFLPM